MDDRVLRHHPSTMRGDVLLFEVAKTSESGGRRAELVLPHGVVQTPVFMPVGTAATVKAVEQRVLERIGTVAKPMSQNRRHRAPGVWAGR